MQRISTITLLVLILMMVCLVGQTSPTMAQRTPRATQAGSAGDGSAGNALAGTATALAATANAAKNKVTKAPPDEAKTAIQTYAQTVLGITVTVKQAGGGSVNISQTGVSQQAQQYAASLAVKTYAATLTNGVASLSYGSGTVTGDISVDVQDSSLGVYSIIVKSGAGDAASALSLAKQTFPGLAGYNYTPYTLSKGYAWYASGTDSVVDLKGNKIKTTTEAVILYVFPSQNGTSTVTATVGRGTYATAIQKP